MDRWVDGFQFVLARALYAPGTEVERNVMLVAALFLGLFVYRKVSNATEIPNPGVVHAIVAYVVGLVLVMSALTASHLFVLPHVPDGIKMWTQVAVMVIISLVVIVPFIKTWQKCQYVSGFMTWFISLAATMAVIYSLNIVFAAIQSGKKDANKARDRKTEVEKFINQ